MPGQAVSTAPRGYLQTPESAPGFWQLGNLWRLMASGYQTGNTLSFIDQLVTSDGGGPCTHMHPSDEGLYVVSGSCTFYAGGESLTAGPGGLGVVPRFTEHAFTVDEPDTQLLNFYLPSGFEMLIMGVAHPAERNELPKKGQVPMAPARLVEQLSRDYGQIEVLGLPFRDPPTPDRMVTRRRPDALVQPFLATSETSTRWWHDGQLWSVLADQARTDGSFSMFEILAPRGTGVHLHLFAASDQFYFLLDGEVDILIGGETKTARKGDFVFVPRGTPHARRVSSDNARLLLLVTPAGFERVIETAGEQTAAMKPPFGTWNERPVDADQQAYLFEEIGLRPLTMADPFF